MRIKFNPEALDRCKIQGLFCLQMKVDIKVMSLFFHQQITSILAIRGLLGSIPAACSMPARID